MIGKVIEATVVLIIVYFVATQSDGFSSLINAASKGYTSSVKALQGR